MTRRTLLLLGVVAGVLVATSAVASATAAAGTTGACDGHENLTAVAVTPDGETITDEESLYPGTELSIVLCDDGLPVDTDDWNLEDSHSYEIDDGESDSHSVAIVLNATEPFTISEFGEADPENELTFSVPSPTIEAEDDSLFGTDLRLSDEAAAAELEQERSTFRETVRDIERTADELTNLTAELESDPDAETVSDQTETLQTLAQHQSDLHNSSADIERTLYNQAMSQTLAEPTVETMEELRDKQDAVDDDANAAAADVRDSLEGVHQDAQSTVRTHVGAGFAGGLLVGAILGAVLPWWKGKEVADFYEVSSRNEFSTDVLMWPWIAGAVLALAGLGLLVWFDILGVLV